MPFCSSCGREMPQEALYCANCGARAADFTVAQSDFSPSHFNSGVTATSQPLTTVPVDEAGPGTPASPAPDEGKWKGGGRRVVLVVVVALAVLLVGVTLETVFVGSGSGAPAVNSPGNPLTGKQLFSAYATNQTKAVAAYANRTLYIQDTLDDGVAHDLDSGRYYSSGSGAPRPKWTISTRERWCSRGARSKACRFQTGRGSPSISTDATSSACKPSRLRPARKARRPRTSRLAPRAASRRRCCRRWRLRLTCCRSSRRTWSRRPAAPSREGRPSCLGRQSLPAQEAGPESRSKRPPGESGR